MRDWAAWYRQYDEDAGMQHRLEVVTAEIGRALAAAPPGPIRVVSMCAGDGRDLLDALRGHPRRLDVEALLVEKDAGFAERGADRARRQGAEGVRFRVGDAGVTTAYRDAVPAGLILACGVFGNIADGDIRRTVRELRALAAPGAVVIWTRTRRPPDVTPAVREWFAEAGFDEVSFIPIGSTQLGSVGVHRLSAEPLPYRPGRRLFRFVV